MTMSEGPLQEHTDSLPERIVKDLGIGWRVAVAHQIHSNCVIYIKSPGLVEDCDGLITDIGDMILSIRVADCVPLFIFCPNSKAIGLIHAGWRGSSQKIIKVAVDQMVNHFGSIVSSLEVFMGPSIKLCCYEVGEAVSDRFSREFLTPTTNNRYLLDLPGVNRSQLESCGVNREKINVDERCTCCNMRQFHSWRRDGEQAGRMICLMSLGSTCSSSSFMEIKG